MAVSLAGCGFKEGFAAATGSAFSLQVRASRPSASFTGLTGRNSCRFPLGPSLDHSLLTKRKVEVRVAADYSDSKSESFKRRGKWGYHPLEDLSKVEKEEIEHAGDGKLTTAEVARTVSEVNWSAFIFSTVVSDKDAVFGTEVQYLVDDHGDLYFEIENDNEFLRSLSSTQIYSMLVGFGNVDGLQFSEVIEAEVEEDELESDSEEESSDESESAEVEIYWDGVEDLEDLEDLDGSFDESFGSLGGWGGGFETLDQVHPMDFASKMSETVSSDHLSDIDKPARRLTITGVARPVTEEEEPYVQGIWYDRFLLAGGDEVDDSDDDDQSDDGDEVTGLVSQKHLKNALQDGGTIVKNQPEGITHKGKSEIPASSHSGEMFGKLSNGTIRGSNEGDIPLRSKTLGTSELSSSDHSLLELPSSSGSTAEDLDAARDGHWEGGDAHEGGFVAREHGKRKHRNKKRSPILDNSDVKDEALEVEGVSEVVLPPGATLEGDAVVSGWTERTKSLEIGSCFFKLEIVNIELDCGPGLQSIVEVRDFAYAEPDVLAHFSSTIMERVNSGGKKMEDAMKALCQRAKSLNVEEVSLVGVDCLGVDLRVRCGIEVQTVRVPFSRRATCEETADKLIDQLLFPRNGQRRQRKRGRDWNSH